MTVDLADRIAAAVTRRWPQRGAAWTAALPDEFRSICGELGVTPVRAFPARFAFVVEAVAGSGERLVLKSSPAPDAGHQAAVLERLSASGVAPTVLLVRHTPTGVWSVMEAVSPGEPLDRASIHAEHSSATRTVLHALAAGAPGPGLVPDLVPWLRARLDDPPADDQPPGRGPARPEVREHALALLDDLLPMPIGRLCHGDLSLGNVLCGDGRLWLVDPRGLNGEPEYDAAVVALKAHAGAVPQAEQLAAALAADTGMDAARARQWVPIAAAATV